jgi:hypothetical protein
LVFPKKFIRHNHSIHHHQTQIIKMKKSTLCRLFMTAIVALGASVCSAQFAFTKSNTLFTAQTHSGCAVTVVDVNNDGLDDILAMDQSTDLVLKLQTRTGSFTTYVLGQVQGGQVWGMSAADVDHNGWKDVVTGSGSAMLVLLGWNGTTVTSTVTQLSGAYFVQNVLFGDFNNDGWVDLEVNDDDDYAKIYQNNAGTLVPSTTLIHTEINPGMTYGGDPYDSGNYGSVYTDFDNDGDLDLYISHCRQSTSSNTDQRRRDRLFVNDGNNNYSEMAQSYGIEVTDFKQTWTTSFGDLDNDGDQDIVMTNHGENGQILRNDGTGHFTDITPSTGFTTTGFDPIESMTEDFDNDGFLDILISGGGPGNSYLLYHNNGNLTFTLTTLPFAAQSNGMLSFGTGDLNHDGRADVFASYGNVYNNPTSTDDVLYLNSTSNSNHFITFSLTGSVSNVDAIGAKVTIYGPWGMQVREVRAGESYGTSCSMQCHFGLGANTMVDSARIDWPSHQVTHFNNLAADQFVISIEGSCSITGNIIPGPYNICTGQTLTLTAAGGYQSYNWSNGDITQSTVISNPGLYNVMVTDAGGCSGISATVQVQLNPDETPSITASGDLVFCSGGSITLTSTPAAAYTWSSGQSTQSIMVTASGIYSVTIQGLCAAFTSDPQVVDVLAAPVAVASDDSAISPNSITLTATGNDISWYDAQTGGNLLQTGPSYTTPVLVNTTTYWVENATSYGGSTNHTGQPYHTGGSLYTATNTNRELYFDVLQNCVLSSVKVYTDVAGTREIQVFNGGGTLVNSVMANIPMDSSLVTLNFALTPGTGYYITTNSSVNQANLGYISPELQRSNSGVTFPYTVSNILSITGSSTGYFYYFYDWKVDVLPTICSSVRIPVQAIMLAADAVSNFTAENNFMVYPNPADHNVTVSFSNAGSQQSTVEFIDAIGQVISAAEIKDAAGNYKQTFDVSNFAKGVYMIHVSSNDKTSYRQLVIQ